MQIKNHKLEGVEFRQARCQGKALVAPSIIVLHETAGRLEKFNSVKWFQSPQCTNASAHFTIERDGTVTQQVLCNAQAWHAGKSDYHGRANVNGFSIGIEIVGPGELTRQGNMAHAYFGQTWTLDEAEMRQAPTHGNRKSYWLPFTPEQIEATVELCQALVAAYPIEDITTHWFISPGRKVDPNPLFPLEHVHEMVLGGPAPVAEDRIAIPAADAEKPTIPVAMAVEGETPAPKAGVIASVTSALDTSDRNFSIIKRLSEQGSRVARVAQNGARWFWGLLVGGGASTQLVPTNRGVGARFVQWVELHPFLFVAICLTITALVVYFLVIKKVQKYLVTAFRDGRYTPSAVSK